MSDEDLRRLERSAAAGDPLAAEALGRAQLRAGQLRLDRARLRLNERWVEVLLAGEPVRIEALGQLPEPTSSPGSHWESGVSTWDEVALHLAPDGQLWLLHTPWQDVHWAGRYAVGPVRWLRSEDGRRWSLADAGPPDPGPPLDRAETGSYL